MQLLLFEKWINGKELVACTLNQSAISYTLLNIFSPAAF